LLVERKNSMNKYIWLFGENLGNTHNNNSYYFWKHVVGRNDNIDKYFVLNKTKENIEFYNCLEAKEKFANCKRSNDYGIFCIECKNGFYLNLNNILII